MESRLKDPAACKISPLHFRQIQHVTTNV
uniref:Uncharacterized protein n=1 Tax=Arundo donax TaxID=35708 RepID=A0A0A9ASD5_ARUDO